MCIKCINAVNGRNVPCIFKFHLMPKEGSSLLVCKFIKFQVESLIQKNLIVYVNTININLISNVTLYLRYLT